MPRRPPKRPKGILSKVLDKEGGELVRDPDPIDGLPGNPSLGWLLTNSPLEDGDLPERKPSRVFRKSEF